MRTPNKLLIAMAVVLVGVSGCSQLRSRRDTPLDEAVRQVELTPPAVAEFRKANANEPVRLADASKAKPSEKATSAAAGSQESEMANPKAVASALPESKAKSADGDFLIGRGITKSQPVKSTSGPETLKADGDASLGSKDLVSSLPTPPVAPGKMPGSLPDALPPAPTLKSASDGTSVVETEAVASSNPSAEGKKIPHAVAKQRDPATLPPAVADGESLRATSDAKEQPATIANVEAAKKEDSAVVASISPPSSAKLPTPPAIVPAVAEVASKGTESPSAERVDPLVKPVSGVEDSLPAPSSMPVGTPPPVLPAAAATELPAVAVSAVQEKATVATMPPMPEKMPEKKIVTVMEVAAKAPIAPAAPTSLATSAPEATPTATLNTHRLHLCTEIIGFGKTVPRETETIAPGERCLAYLEVSNFVSKETDREFETKLGCDLSIENAAGQTVFNQTFPDILDKCVTPRRDFFCHFLFSMPTTLLTGKYTLRVRIVDRNNSSTSEAVLDLLVGSKETTNSVSDGGSSTKRSIETGDSLSTPNQLGNSEGNKSKGLDQS